MSDIKITCAYTELKAPNELLPSPKNPNKHSPAQIERLCLLIKHHGFRHPIIVSKNSGFIVAGHGRWECALKLNLSYVPVDYQEFENPDAEYSFMVADNAIAGWSDLDLALINSEMINLGPDFDIDLLAIENFEIDLSLKEAELPKIKDEDAPTLKQITFTLHIDQLEQVELAMKKAKNMGEFVNTNNENSNGNAIARVAEFFLGTYA